MTKRNSTDDTDTDDLRRAFVLALSDAIKGEKVTAAALEIARKYLADKEAENRWRVEQAALLAGAAAAPGGSERAPDASTETYPEDYAPPVPASMIGMKFPFPVARRGVQHPPAKDTASEASEDTSDQRSEKAKDWTRLSQVAFLSPE
jgi:hypothetical protein